MPNVITIRQAVQRSKADGLPVSEYALRRWIKTGVVPVRMIGHKALIYYPNLVKYIQCEGNKPTPPVAVETALGTIRRIEI